MFITLSNTKEVIDIKMHEAVLYSTGNKKKSKLKADGARQ